MRFFFGPLHERIGNSTPYAFGLRRECPVYNSTDAATTAEVAERERPQVGYGVWLPPEQMARTAIKQTHQEKSSGLFEHISDRDFFHPTSLAVETQRRQGPLAPVLAGGNIQ